MPAKTKEIRLKAIDLPMREDFGTGIARLELSRLKEIEAIEGDIIEIRAGKSTGCIALTGEECGDCIRMDSMSRRNCEAGIGETVAIRKIRAKEAETVTLSLARKGLNIHLSSEEIKKNLLLRPMKAGDVILPTPLPGREGSFQEILNKDVARALLSTSLEERFVVVSTSPEGIVRVSDKTEIYISNEAFSAVKDLEEPFASKVINVKRLPELKTFIEVKSMDDIKKLISSGIVINRYEDDKFVVYFGGSYFSKILKSA